MSYLIYTTYAVLLLIFLVLSGFAVFHALKYSYISPRMKPITWVFVLVSSVLILASLYLLFALNL